MIISLIPVCVTLLLGVMGFIVNTLMQRKTNSIEVITRTRIDRLEKTKEIMSKFVQYSDIDCLNANISVGKASFVINELNKFYSDLRSLYTFTFYKDVDLVKICNKLKQIIVAFLNDHISDKEYVEKIAMVLPKFEKEFDLYIRTDWSRIKVETAGKKKKGDSNSWEKDYKVAEKRYSKLN